MGKIICAAKPGGPEVLELREKILGNPGPNEVLIKQTKIGLNFLDVYQTSGLYPFPENDVFIPGNEAAGEVISVGENVKNLKISDRVAYAMVVGSFAEERIIKADRLVKIPTTVSDEIAAASMLQGMTVEYLVNRCISLNPGDKVLFHAAAGGVGLIAGQWLKYLGVESIGTVGTKDKIQLAKDAGYDYVINYSEEDFVEAAMDFTKGKGVKVVYDSVGKDTYPNSLKVLEKYGLLVAFGQSSGVVSDFKLSDLQLNGSLYAQRPTLGNYIQTRDELVEVSNNLFKMLENEKIKISINQYYDLENTKQAFIDLIERKTTGASVIKV